MNKNSNETLTILESCKWTSSFEKMAKILEKTGLSTINRLFLIELNPIFVQRLFRKLTHFFSSFLPKIVSNYRCISSSLYRSIYISLLFYLYFAYFSLFSLFLPTLLLSISPLYLGTLSPPHLYGHQLKIQNSNGTHI